MIKDRMTLALSVDTQYLKTTVDAMSESDETLSAYAVGFIPWDLVQESTLFNWIRYNVKYTYNVAASISPVDNPYTDGTQLSATKGIPFMYAVSPTASPTQERALYKSPLTGVFSSAGDSYKSGTAYNTANTDIKNILHSIDLSDIVSNGRNATPYMQAQFASVAILYDNDTYDFDNAFTYTTAPINYNPVTDSIDSFTCRYVINGVIFTRTITDTDFKTWGKIGYSGTIETGGHKYAIFDYCVGIYCINSLQINGYLGAHVNGFIANNFPFRYTSTIGLHDSYNYPSSGGFSGFPQGYGNAKNCACGFNTPYSSSPIDWSVFANNDSAPTIDVILNNNDRSEITETYYRYKTSMAFSVLMKSYTAIDLKIMALISTPIVKVNNAYYCPEFDENYALTGEWVEYTNQNLNPDSNEFNPADIPEPGPEPSDDIHGRHTGSTGSLYGSGVGAVSNFVTHWVLNASQIQTFGGHLWKDLLDFDAQGEPIGTQLWKNAKIAVNTYFQTGSFDPGSILELLIGLRYFPINLAKADYATQMTVPAVYFGTGRVGVDVTTNPWKLNDCGIYITGGDMDLSQLSWNKYDDWRDVYNVSASIYIPFCGTYELPWADIYNGTLHLSYGVDVLSGALTAFVECTLGLSRFMVCVGSGMVGFEVPITATNANRINAAILGDMGNMMGTLFNPSDAAKLTSSLVGAETGSSAGIPTGESEPTVTNAAGSAPIVGQAALAGRVAEIHAGIASRPGITCPALPGGRGWGALTGQRIPFITVRKGRYVEGTGYGHAAGYPRMKVESIGNMSGYTQCINPDLSGIDCTKAERDMIKQILETGFYA